MSENEEDPETIVGALKRQGKVARVDYENRMKVTMTGLDKATDEKDIANWLPTDLFGKPVVSVHRKQMFSDLDWTEMMNESFGSFLIDANLM